jgi:hypothetical protein
MAIEHLVRGPLWRRRRGLIAAAGAGHLGYGFICFGAENVSLH